MLAGQSVNGRGGRSKPSTKIPLWWRGRYGIANASKRGKPKERKATEHIQPHPKKKQELLKGVCRSAHCIVCAEVGISGAIDKTEAYENRYANLERTSSLQKAVNQIGRVWFFPSNLLYRHFRF